jgi:RNA polymerase sigma factor (sigma-70 family)
VTDSGLLIRIESCIPALRRYAYTLLRNRQDVDDLVQDCLVRALNKLHTHRDGADIRPWLFTIMRNLFINRVRRFRARPVCEPLDEAHEVATSMRPDQESGLQCRDLIRYLGRLPVEQRTIVLLVSVEDLSYAEIASILGVPIGTIMSRLSRGRARLREMIENDEVGTRERCSKSRSGELR